MNGLTIGFRQMRLTATSFAIVLAILAPSTLRAQRLVLESRETKSGTVQSVGTGTIEVTTSDGKTLVCKIQEPGEETVALSKVVIRFPAKVDIHGQLPINAVVAGMSVQVKLAVNRLGRTRGIIEKLHVSETGAEAGVIKNDETSVKGFFDCDVIGRVESCQRGRLILRVPVGGFVTKGRIIAQLAKKDVHVSFRSNQYRKIKPGDKVEKMVVARFSTGDYVIESIDVEMARDNAQSATQDQDAKYSNLSDDPPDVPRSVRSAHFVLVTDISDRKAKILLDNLEYMINLVSKYFGRPPKGLIKCVVARNVSAFASFGLPQHAYQKMRNNAGVTVSQSLGRQVTATVYACDDFGVVQHEAMHAYCSQTFGSTGPTWYAEGMAEMGNYWKEGQLAVDIQPSVITYLKNSKPKSLLKIVEPGQVTGDSWQAYAWRWALCHMLAYNPNYAPRFKALGMNMMSKQAGFSFESVYGPAAQQISFEYDFFVQHFDNGYRVDLCAWDWKGTKSCKKISGTSRVKKEILAKRGWQPAGVQILAGQSYDVASIGTWNVAKNVDCDADGTSDGQGCMEGVILTATKLGEPFRLGKLHRFTAGVDGILFVRCREDWTRLADNNGSIQLHVRRSPSE
jgi:hypothetical protein